MDLQIQDGRLTTIVVSMIGAEALGGATVLTLTAPPTIGNLFNDGVVMGVSSTISISLINAGKLTFLAESAILGSTNFVFEDAPDEYSANIEVVVGKIGSVILYGKARAPIQIETDVVPREVPAILADKLAHAIAARLLERGDRTDKAMASSLFNRFFDAKLDAITQINKLAGRMRRSNPI